MTTDHINLSSNLKPENQESQHINITALSTILGKLFSPLINSVDSLVKPTNLEKDSSKYNRTDTANLKLNSIQTNDKIQSLKRKAKPNILTIDLRKIEGISCLSDKEKNNLKTILKNNRLENEGGIRHKKNMSRIATFRNVTKMVRPTNNSNNNPFEELQNPVSRNNFKVNTCKKSNKIDSKFITRGNNPQLVNEYKCELCRISKRLNILTTNFHQQTVGSSDYFDRNRAVKTSKLHPASIDDSSCTTRNILKAKPNININNLRVKYVNPTCFMQYTTNTKERFSTAALKAHLGQGQCPVSVSQRPDLLTGRDRLVNVENNEDYIIARGTMTAEEIEESFKVLKEVRKSMFPSGSRSNSDSLKKHPQETTSTHLRGRSMSEIIRMKTRVPSGFQKFRKSSSSKSESLRKSSLKLTNQMDSNDKKSKWEVDSFTSTLLHLEKNVSKSKKPVGKFETGLHKKSSTLENLMWCFMKTCFCLCFRGDSKPTNQKNYKKDSKVETQNKIPQNPFGNHLKVIRTTESKFFNKRLPKQKQL